MIAGPHDDALENARRVWPDFDVPSDVFAKALARVEPSASLHASDLYLAQACIYGVRRALEVFDRQFLPRVEPAVARVCKTDVPIEEAIQSTREKLLLGGPDKIPKLGQYTGEGELVSWLRVVAVRDAIALRRVRVPPSHAIDEASVIAGNASAHDELVWKRHATELKAAIEAGIRELSVRERNMLRMNLLDGMTIDGLAVLFHVHRATAARQLTKARESVLKHARAQIRSKLQISDSEAQSLFGDLMSQIELSLSRVLGRSTEGS